MICSIAGVSAYSIPTDAFRGDRMGMYLVSVLLVAQMTGSDWECQKMIDEYRSLSEQVRPTQRSRIDQVTGNWQQEHSQLAAQAGQALGNALGALGGVPSPQQRLKQLDQSIRQDCVSQ